LFDESRQYSYNLKILFKSVPYEGKKYMQKSFFSLGRVIILALLVCFCSFGQADARPFAVHYDLKGIVAIQEGVACLYTADGCVFKLLMNERKAAEYDGKSVSIEGKVGKADEVENVKVKKITEIPRDDIEVEEVEHEAYQRPAKMLSDAKGLMKVSNIRWDIYPDPAVEEKKALHTWKDLVIDPSKVIKAYYVVKPFAPKFIAAHTLLAFSFENGGAVSTEGEDTHTIVLTIEAYKKLGQTYGLIKTMKKEYDIVWILTTLRNYADLNVNFNKSSDTELSIYPINFDKAQTRALLEETIRQSCVNRQGEYYNTIRNNCTNNLVILMNRVLPESKRMKLWKIPGMIYNPKATMPLSVVKMLKKKGFIGEPLVTINRGNFEEALNQVR